MLAIHFDPTSGAPYWLEVARRVDFDPRENIQNVEDLARLGPMDQEALATRPIEDFIPRSQLHHRARWIVAESGGTLGAPKFAVHRRDEFHAAFVEPFLAAARLAGFPREEPWLFIGPSGPHIIALAARACAVGLGAAEPFSVDFDPRWAKKLPEDSFALTRYRAHIQEQALRILRTQRVGVLFSTPPVIDGLGEQMEEKKRAAIRGIHFGGMAVGADLLRRLRTLFPHAVMLAGYGNTLLGMAPQLRAPQLRDVHVEQPPYYPHGARLILRPVPLGEAPDDERIKKQVGLGERGQVMAHRLDETQLILNLLERDTAIRVAPPAEARGDGFLQEGIGDPQPLVQGTAKPALGLY
jgi:phenylacetate-coenzyme A ligase PaaK-like adenylate-forming protein